MTMRQSFLFFFLLFSFYYSWSQDLVYKHYGLQDGLANPTIHSIFQDKDGFLWIGTESGLSRYDGTRFKTFTVKDGLPNNEVLGLFQDSKNRLWLQFYKNSISYIYHGKIHNQGLLKPSYIVTGYSYLHTVYLEDSSMSIYIPAYSLKYSYVSGSVFYSVWKDGLRPEAGWN